MIRVAATIVIIHHHNYIQCFFHIQINKKLKKNILGLNMMRLSAKITIFC